MKEVMLIEVVKDADVVLPHYASDGAFAMDLRSAEDHRITNGNTAVISTGLRIAVPTGYALRIVSRSGMASKGVFVTNGLGLIDEDYRGTIGIILTNLSSEYFEIHKGDRIAQCYLEKKIPMEFVVVDELSSTNRGEDGFGSTGK